MNSLLTFVTKYYNYLIKCLILINKAVEEAGLEAEVVENLIKHDYVTINKGRDGKMYAYYFDGDSEAIVEVETLNVIDNNEAEALFC